MKLLSVVGARPQFVKLAPIDRVARERRIEHVIVHTGQHYDDIMSDSFFRELGISAPKHNLLVGSGSHGAQTGRMLESVEAVLVGERPDGVIVYGDTNSTVAAALAAVKVHIPLFHLEAGLRSFNRRMPEEHNRVITDHCADLCLAPTKLAMRNLESEGLSDRSIIVGDVMADVCFETARRFPDNLRVDLDISLASGYYLATIHRADNTDDQERLREIVESLSRLDRPVLLAAHPRLVSKATAHGIDIEAGVIELIDPLSYPDMIRAVRDASCVITDSGGLQKECFLLRTPCLTLRSETEWPETVELGWNTLVSPMSLPNVLRSYDPPATRAEPYGAGDSAQRVIDSIYGFFRDSRGLPGSEHS
ncbi:non-hydrolyzing UDP-N-acetylglucosamine 2-epimerase [Dietzia massiliensis]|uniref:non-hydrolyzing UDP-N-acetylglucosamine 2-epimerase n=1 Tax=Dietzia massiliensis TaxID=2697499 RepID=UPI001BD06D0A|nr:UDP-N-acetylglucosamine 2-epimerase (non-hydrolyzing) [Dietzia massiliensis]MBS7548191.1 UDP-N-acetylglucosamine 2-epimerase (non-hydrolyzing) [Dietzia massiliensis]